MKFNKKHLFLAAILVTAAAVVFELAPLRTQAAPRDDFASNAVSVDSPPLHFFAITPADGSDLTVATRAIHVGGAGDVTIVGAGDADGTTVTLKGCSAGQVISGRFKRVMSTNTTATDLVGEY